MAGTWFSSWRGTVFVTLTYPSEWSRDGRKWRRDLVAFRHALVRRFGSGCRGFWKREYQHRGAAHFHLWFETGEAYVGEQLAELRVWVSETWYRIVGSGDEKHLLAGTNVRAVTSGHPEAYLKAYLSKRLDHGQNQVPDDVTSIGRFWGYFGYKPQEEVCEISEEELLRILRTCRRFVDRRCRSSQGRRYRGLSQQYVGDWVVEVLRWVIPGGFPSFNPLDISGIHPAEFLSRS